MARRDPPVTCRKCVRLVAYRKANRIAYPDFHNAPVPTWGPDDAPLLIIGLAPGLKGANRTGQPFTGDQSGALLFECMELTGLATKDGPKVTLHRCAITNAVACVPPENRPTGTEVGACRPYLAAKLAQPRVLLALGKVAHDAVLRTLGARVAAHPFSHGAKAELGEITLFSSFHPSRYNVATKRINAAMLSTVLASCVKAVDDV